MSKGVIVEVKERHAIVLTDEGAFVRMPRRGLEAAVGEEIALPAPRARSLRRRTTLWSSAAAAVLVLAVFLYTLVPSSAPPAAAKPVAYVSIDINPSVQLGLDASSTVVEARGHSEHTEEWVEGLGLVGLPLEHAVSAVMEAAEQSVLNEREEADIVITSVIVDDSAPLDEGTLQEKVRTEVDRVLRENHAERADSYRVTVWSAPKEVLEEAETAGLTAGKMTFLLKAKANGVDVTAEELKKETIREVAKKYGGENLLDPDPKFTKETLTEILKQLKEQRKSSSAGGGDKGDKEDDRGEKRNGKKRGNDKHGNDKRDNEKKRNDKQRNDDRRDDNRLASNNRGNHLAAYAAFKNDDFRKNDRAKANRINNNKKDANLGLGRVRKDGDSRKIHVSKSGRMTDDKRTAGKRAADDRTSVSSVTAGKRSDADSSGKDKDRGKDASRDKNSKKSGEKPERGKGNDRKLHGGDQRDGKKKDRDGKKDQRGGNGKNGGTKKERENFSRR